MTRYIIPAGTRCLVRCPPGSGDWEEHTTAKELRFSDCDTFEGGCYVFLNPPLPPAGSLRPALVREKWLVRVRAEDVIESEPRADDDPDQLNTGPVLSE